MTTSSWPVTTNRRLESLVTEEIRKKLAQFALDQKQCSDNVKLDHVLTYHFLYSFENRIFASYRYTCRSFSRLMIITSQVSCDLWGNDLKIVEEIKRRII